MAMCVLDFSLSTLILNNNIMNIVKKIIDRIEEIIIDLIFSGRIVFMSGGSSGRKKHRTT